MENIHGHGQQTPTDRSNVADINTSASSVNSSAGNKSSEEVMIYEQLQRFLKSIGMESYVRSFIDAGFISMDDFGNITFEDLIAMNIPNIYFRLRQLKQPF